MPKLERFERELEAILEQQLREWFDLNGDKLEEAKKAVQAYYAARERLQELGLHVFLE